MILRTPEETSSTLPASLQLLLSCSISTISSIALILSLYLLCFHRFLSSTGTLGLSTTSKICPPSLFLNSPCFSLFLLVYSSLLLGLSCFSLSSLFPAPASSVCLLSRSRLLCLFFLSLPYRYSTGILPATACGKPLI